MRVALKQLGVYGTLCGLIVVLASIYCGHASRAFASEPGPVGFPWDWSHDRLVFSKTNDPEVSSMVQKDPRALHQWLRSNRGFSQQEADEGLALISPDTFMQSDNTPVDGWDRVRPMPPVSFPWWYWERRHRARRDWGASLGATNFKNVNDNSSAPVYPAKYTFDVNATPSCTNDYAAFPTGAQSKTNTNPPTNPNGQAAIVGYKNLYSTQPTAGGYCNTDGPTVAWSYINAACPATQSNDPILSSPVLSLDGTKVAWVTSAGKVQILTIGSGGAAPAALAPLCIGPVLSGGDGSSLQSVQLGNAAHNPASGVSLSQLFVDYNSDSAYVADDDGFLHKIKPFFTATGTLQEVTTPAWQASHSYSVGNLIVDNKGFIEKCTTAGTSNGGQPGWSTTWGGTTTDNTLTWTNQGSGGGWPVYVTGVSTHPDTSKLSAPIYDNISKNIFVGDEHGSLFYVLDPGVSAPVGSCANGASLYPCVGLPGTTTGIPNGGGPQQDCSTPSPGPITCLVMSNHQGFIDSVIVDSSNNLVITQFSNADNTNAAVEQTNTSFSVFHSATLAGQVNLSYHAGTFDNLYFSNPASGYFYACGPDSTGHMTNLYRVSFTNTSGTIALGSVNGTPLHITTANNSGNCSPLTEIYNTATSTDWLFLSVDNHGTTSTCNNQSCIMSFVLGSSMVNGVSASYAQSANLNGTGGIIVDNVANTTTFPQASSIYFVPIAKNLTCGDGSTNSGCAIKLTQLGLN